MSLQAASNSYFKKIGPLTQRICNSSSQARQKYGTFGLNYCFKPPSYNSQESNPAAAGACLAVSTQSPVTCPGSGTRQTKWKQVHVGPLDIGYQTWKAYRRGEPSVHSKRKIDQGKRVYRNCRSKRQCEQRKHDLLTPFRKER